MVEAISIREFARRDGCSDKLVREAITHGYLKKLPDGKLDAKFVGTLWRKGNRSAEEGADPPRKTADTPHRVRTPTPAELDVRVELELQPHGGALKRSHRDGADGDALLDDEDEASGRWSLAIADRRKATALAMLRELELDTKIGAVVPAAEVAALVGAEYARVRTRLLAIPAEQAPRLHRLKTPVEVQDALHAVIVQALEELTQDAGSEPG